MLESKEYRAKMDGFTAHINRLRELSDDMRKDYQSIVDSNPESICRLSIRMLDQEAKLLDIIEQLLMSNFELREYVDCLVAKIKMGQKTPRRGRKNTKTQRRRSG